jgi:hypothetical protein
VTQTKRSFVPADTAAADAKPGTAAFAIFSVSSGEARRDGEYHIVPGKLFEVGAWPDKEFSLSENEADRAIRQASSGPLPLDIEHKPSILDGALGEIRRVWREGKNLQAEFAVPDWLWNVTKGAGKPLRVSATWERATKRLKGAAWVLDPRIKDAELVAAFSKREDRQKPFAAREPCVKSTFGAGELTTRPPRQQGDPRRGIGHRSCVRGGAYMTPAQKKLRELLAARGVGDKLSDDDLDAVFAEEIAEKVKRDAEAFADKWIRTEKRAMPHEREYLIAMFTVAAQDDHRSEDGTVTFSLADVPKKTARTALLEAALGARERHGLTEERLRDPAEGSQGGKKGDAQFSERSSASSGDDDLTLPARYPDRRDPDPEDDDPASVSPERLEKLLKTTPLGEAVLSDLKMNRNGGGR